MIINEIYCEFCGKNFFDKYWIGGYIDHYESFSRPDRHRWIGETSERAFNEIVRNGNDYRSIKDIEERLNCFMQWNDVSDEVKRDARCKCEFLIEKMKKAEDKAKQIVSEMTMLERRFLVDEAKQNCSRPYGYEDGKLYDGFDEWKEDYDKKEHPFEPKKYFSLNDFLK